MGGSASPSEMNFSAVGKSKVKMPDIKLALRNKMANAMNYSAESSVVSARASTAAAGFKNYR